MNTLNNSAECPLMQRNELWSRRRCSGAAIASAEMTLVTDINALLLAAVSGCVSPPRKMCFTVPVFLEAQHWGNISPGVNKRHYVLLIILNKYVAANMTRSHPDDLWRAFLTAGFLLCSLSAPQTFGRKLRSTRPIIGGRTEKPVTQI